jgi:hypothetical protein
MGILVEDTNDFAISGLYHATSRDNWDITYLVVVYALDVYNTVW